MQRFSGLFLRIWFFPPFNPLSPKSILCRFSCFFCGNFQLEGDGLEIFRGIYSIPGGSFYGVFMRLVFDRFGFRLFCCAYRDVILRRFVKFNSLEYR